MKNYMVVKVVVLAVLGGVSCGGEKSPAEKCEDLVDLVCDRAVECIAGASGMHRECVEGVEQSGLQCSTTKSVKPSYDRCVDLLNDQSCQTLFPADPDTGDQTIALPTECNGVVVTQSAGGEIDRASYADAPPADPIGDAAARARTVLESRRE